MNRCIPVFVLIAVLFPSGLRARETAETSMAPRFDASSFPVLKGEIKMIAGSFDTFGRPRVGDLARISVAELLRTDKLKGKTVRGSRITFFPPEYQRRPNSYINLPDIPSLNSVGFDAKAGFRHLKLKAAKGTQRVRIDFAHVPGKGKRQFEMWIIAEFNGVTRGVIFIECEALTALSQPGR